VGSVAAVLLLIARLSSEWTVILERAQMAFTWRDRHILSRFTKVTYHRVTLRRLLGNVRPVIIVLLLMGMIRSEFRRVLRAGCKPRTIARIPSSLSFSLITGGSAQETGASANRVRDFRTFHRRIEVEPVRHNTPSHTANRMPDATPHQCKSGKNDIHDRNSGRVSRRQMIDHGIWSVLSHCRSSADQTPGYNPESKPD
jgi:hypothetical protein